MNTLMVNMGDTKQHSVFIPGVFFLTSYPKFAAIPTRA
jgi:hypothetical protein